MAPKFSLFTERSVVIFIMPSWWADLVWEKQPSDLLQSCAQPSTCQKYVSSRCDSNEKWKYPSNATGFAPFSLAMYILNIRTFYRIAIYSRTSMTRTSLEPKKFVRDMGSSSHWGLIVEDQEAKSDNLGKSFQFSIQYTEGLWKRKKKKKKKKKWKFIF